MLPEIDQHFGVSLADGKILECKMSQGEAHVKLQLYTEKTVLIKFVRMFRAVYSSDFSDLDRFVMINDSALLRECVQEILTSETPADPNPSELNHYCFITCDDRNVLDIICHDWQLSK